MLIEWSDLAEADLAEILSYFICRHEEYFGQNAVSQVLKSVNRLVDNPLSGRRGRLKSIRELVVRQVPYIVYYRII